MRRIFWLVLLVAAIHGPALAQTESIDVLRRMFDYEKNAALDIKEVGVINRSNVRIHDITYASPKSGRVTAYLVVPTGRGRFAGIVFSHRGYGTRTEFLPEAILYVTLIGSVFVNPHRKNNWIITSESSGHSTRSITCLTPDQRLCCFNLRASSNISMKRRCSSTRERQVNPNSFYGMTRDTP